MEWRVLRSLDLFTGYGGLTLALEEWCKPIAYVEIEEYPQRIVAERMADGTLPRAPLLADVENVRGEPGVCDIIVGGFPCQDISSAGRGAGLAGERSVLFFEIARLTEEIRPSFVFLENVPAIRTRGLFTVAETFSEMGYDCRWTTVSAAAVGAPHKRERWFLLAHTSCQRRQQESSGRHGNEGADEGRPSLQTDITTGDGKGRGYGDVAHTNGKGLEGQPQSEVAGERTRSNKTSHARLPTRQDWQTEPNVGRVVNGTPFRVDRLKALGNGVVPLQAKTAFELLLGLHHGETL